MAAEHLCVSAPTCAAGSWLPRQVFKPRERVSSHGSLGAQCALVYQSAPTVFGGLVGYRPAWAQTVRFCIRALSPAPRVDGWHSVLGRRVFTQRSPLAQHALPQSVFAPSALHAQQEVGWHSVFWHRMSSSVSPHMRSRQLVGEPHQQYRSYDLLYCPQGCPAQGSVSPTLSIRLFVGTLWW